MVLMLIYDYLTLSREDFVKSCERRKRHYYKHANTLTKVALPIFVAASISRSVVAVVEVLAAEELSTEIWINFFYAFIVCAFVGYYVIHMYPSDKAPFHYFFHLASENSAFAFKDVFILIVLDSVTDSLGVASAFGVWCSIVASILVVCIVSCYVQVTYIKPDPIKSKHMMIFRAEAFSLGLAYTLLSIFLSDELNVNEDDDETADASNGPCSWFSFAFPFFLTTAISFLLAYTNPEEDDDSKTVDSANNNADADCKGKNMGCEVWCKSVGSWIRRTCFYWDNENHVISQSLGIFLRRFCGLLVGCAWYDWAILSFIPMFERLKVLGLFLFAILMTDGTLNYMTRLTIKAEKKLEEGKEISFRSSERIQLMLTAAGLVCGWSWEEFVIACFSLLLDDDNESLEFKWIRACAKVGMAIFVALVGGFFYIRYIDHSSDEEENLEEKESQDQIVNSPFTHESSDVSNGVL